MEVIFSTNQTETYPFEADKEQLTIAASILASKILDFANNGGDIKNLTPKALFGKKEEL